MMKVTLPVAFSGKIATIVLLRLTSPSLTLIIISEYNLGALVKANNLPFAWTYKVSLLSKTMFALIVPPISYSNSFLPSFEIAYNIPFLPPI